MSRQRAAAYGCLALSMVLVGSYVGLSKLLLGVMPVWLLAWLRFGIAAICMARWVRRAPGEAALGRRTRWLLFWQSLLGQVLFSVCMLQGVAMTSALSAGVVLAAIPAAVALLSWRFLGEVLVPRTRLGLGCAVAGIALLACARDSGASAASAGVGQALQGHALLLMAVFCEASYVVIGKRLSRDVPARRITALINLCGWALLAPVGLWQAAHFDFTQLDAAAWGLLLYYALAASVASVWLWMRGLAHVPAVQAGVYTVLLPLSAAAVGVTVLGETYGPAHAVALLLALAGVLLASWPAKVEG